jgi:hypothetical protein
MKRSKHILWLSGIALLLGCSRPETVEVSGNVTWQGAPISNGDIVFVATDPHIAAVAGKISDGAFTLRCKPGDKRVEIQSYRLTGRKTLQGNPEGEMYIPERYNTKSELAANVILNGTNTLEFALKP